MQEEGGSHRRQHNLESIRQYNKKLASLSLVHLLRFVESHGTKDVVYDVNNTVLRRCYYLQNTLYI